MDNRIEKGTRFGKLTVLAYAYTTKDIDYYFVKCKCGKIGKAVSGELLKSGYLTNCGCEKEAVDIFKHPLHKVWDSMKTRCNNPKRQYYHLYGGRGIKVCDEWLSRANGYINFYTWSINNGYKYEIDEKTKKNKYTLDRIDVNRDYCPENCRWVHMQEQSNNTRADGRITFRGETKTVKEFLKDLNASVPYFNYLLKTGMNEIEALQEISQE